MTGDFSAVNFTLKTSDMFCSPYNVMGIRQLTSWEIIGFLNYKDIWDQKYRTIN